MHILALEPFAAASHVAFLEGYAAHSAHQVELALLPARHWKWRMRTSAMIMLQRVIEAAPDVLLVSDFLNLAELRALLPPHLRNIPAVCYFHENQLTYPQPEGQKQSRDVHHGLTNIHNALTAERSLFNSNYHRTSFITATEKLLGKVPKLAPVHFIEQLTNTSYVCPLATDLAPGQAVPESGPPNLLWNHRWEYDKAPGVFAQALDELHARHFDFRLILLGERFQKKHPALAQIEANHQDRILHNGHADSKAAYVAALDQAHLAISTSHHEFFGLATLEAITRGARPVLPHDLAYPELLPAELHTEPNLYGSPGSALRDPKIIADCIQTASAQIPSWQPPTAHMAQFCWPKVAPQIDLHIQAATT